MIPHDLVPWWTAYRWYRAWAADGTWDAVHDQLRALVRIAAGKDPAPSAAVLDAQSVKSSEGGQARGFDMAKKTTGRKRHLVVDTLGLVLVAMATSTKPSVSTTRCRLRPVVFLAMSKPRAWPPSLLLTDWASSTAAEGAGSLPAAIRTSARSWSWTASQVPSAAQARYHR